MKLKEYEKLEVGDLVQVNGMGNVRKGMIGKVVDATSVYRKVEVRFVGFVNETCSLGYQALDLVSR